VPCGLSRAGLPVGLQIVSGHFRDAEVLALAGAYAEAHPLSFPVLPETK
jgi:aspartyl-tRNA(Asn)/glutamyl-tRNA(Gln) amidotransferase subunit A